MIHKIQTNASSQDNQEPSPASHPWLLQRIAELEAQLAAERQSRCACDARWHSFLQTVGSVIIMLSPDFRILEWNQEAEQIYGWQRHEVLNKPYMELFLSEAERAAVIADCQKVLRGEPTRGFENPVITRDGSHRTLLWNATRLLNSQGQPEGLLVSGQDITERRTLEQAERQSQALLQGIVDKSSAVIFAKNLEGRLALANEQFDTFFGAERGAFIGKTDHDFLPAEVAEQNRANDLEVQRTGRPSEFEEQIPGADGIRTYLSMKFPIYDHNGTLCAVGGVCTDITERKQIEASLRHSNAELARAVRLRDDFLATMSHELRTPLSVILGISQALSEEAYGPLTSKQRALLEDIDASGQQLLRLINNILELAQLEAGKLVLNVGVVSVEEVCQFSLRAISEQAASKQLTVAHHRQPAATKLCADRRRLKQILGHLLDNATKFTPEGGTIGLDVTSDDNNEAIRFTIWDTGIGIASQDIRWLFKPFTQLDGSLAKQYPGAGLGLAVVARLVALHGGSISVESTLHQGSRFTVLLPLNTHKCNVWLPQGYTEEDELALPELPATTIQVPAQRAPAIGLGPPPARSSILLVEDNEHTVHMLQDYLTMKGYQVIVAQTGRAALEQARATHPSLVLMDIQLPEMDGLEAIRHLRADETLSATPVIALTALAMPGDRERCLAAGANEYVIKPFKLKSLITTIERYLHHT